MKELWYGDNGDFVKWATLVHLAQREKIHTIVQVAFFRDTQKPQLECSKEIVSVPQEVWNHFKDLHEIVGLGRRLSLRIIIIDQPFDPKKRQVYQASVAKKLRHLRSLRKIVILDPDTGIELGRAKAEHVKVEEIQEFWKVLADEDWLVLYQHGYRVRRWWVKPRDKFAEACKKTDRRPSHIETFQMPDFANDVALFATAKS